MFWTSWGDSPKIERASLNGEDRISIATSGLARPNDIIIDFQDDRLYWTDVGLDRIEVADYDGSNRRQLLYQAGVRYVGLTVLSNSLFSTTWNRNVGLVLQTDKTNGTLQGSFSFPGEPMGLAAYDSSRQPTGEVTWDTLLASFSLTPVVPVLVA